MNWKKTFGTALLFLISWLSIFSCSDIEYVALDSSKEPIILMPSLTDSINNEVKTFGKMMTRASLVPEWTKLSRPIRVYSISDENEVLVISDATVYDIDRNLGKITVEVAKECKGYFATYPNNMFDYDVGDMIDINSAPAKTSFEYTGYFGDVCLMTSWCDWCKGDGYFLFDNLISLFRVTGVKNSDFPMKFKIFYRDLDMVRTNPVPSFSKSEFYVPISATTEVVDSLVIFPKANSGKDSIVLYPKSPFEVGHIYSYSLH